MKRRNLVRAVMVWLAAVTVIAMPADAAQVKKVVTGSVQAPLGRTVRVDRIRYTNSGCAQDARDGVFGAYIDVRGFKGATVQVGTADIVVPTEEPALEAALWPGCDPMQVQYAGQCGTATYGACFLQITNQRFLEVTLSSSSLGAAGVHFTVTLWPS